MGLSLHHVNESYRRYYQPLETVLKKPKTKTYSTIIFFFLVVALFGWYAIKPTIQTILYLRREIQDKMKVNASMDEKISMLIEAQGAYEEAQPKLQLLSHAIPDDTEALQLVSRIKELVSTAQASMSAIQISTVPLYHKPLPSANVDIQPVPLQPDSYPVNITVEGSYTSIKQFLTQVTHIRRIITVNSLKFVPMISDAKGTQSSTDIIRLVLQLSTYYASP